MKRNARSAFTVLKNKDVHVFEDEGHGWGAHFYIGCEPRTNDEIPVGDFYQEFIREHIDDDGKIQNAFGIRTWVHDLLTRKELYAEWINPGLLGVYDA